MRPLVSPVLEYRLMGIASLLGGLAFGLVALRDETVAAAVGEVLLVGALFGTGVYTMVLQPYAHDAVRAPAAPTAGREPIARTLRRVVLTNALLLGLMAALVAAMSDPALVAGITAGSSAAYLLTSRLLRRAWNANVAAGS